MITLRIMASRHSVFYTPLLATFTGGFLQQEGMDAVYSVLPQGLTVGDFIASGEVDVVQSAVSYSWTVLEKGGVPPAMNFAHINTRDGFFIAARSPDPSFNFRRLLDKRLMFVHGGQPQAMLRYALYKQGVDLSALKTLDAGVTELMMEAFRLAQGDYFHEQAPYPQQLAEEGLAHVVASVGEAIGPVSFSTLAASPKWLTGPHAARFMRAFRKARAWAHTGNPQHIAQRLAYLFPAVSETALIKGIDAYQRLGCWSGEVEITAPLYEVALDVFEHSRLIRWRWPIEQAVVKPPDA